MGLLRTLLTAPVSAPVKGTFWIAQKIEEAADAEINNPAEIRRTLAALEQKLLAGEISEVDYDAAETTLLQRLKAMS